MDKCIYCGSSNIEKGISVSGLNSGLKYKKFLVPLSEFFFADLCKDCGSVRLYVKETNREWE